MNLQRFKIDPLPLGCASLSTLMKAFDTVEKRDVCLEVVSLDHYEDYQEYFDNEVAILKKLKHQNVIGFYGSFSTNERFYIALEFVKGGDLESYLRNVMPPLPEATVLSFFSQMISFLKYLHQLKVIHRDLKPGNILLAEGNIVKISGFTFSKLFETDDFVATSKVGTPSYLPPEIIKEEPYSFPVDVWCLGCIIYECMTGKPPFYHQNIAQLEKLITTTDPNPIGGNYSPVLKETVMKMLEKDPNKRISIEQIQKSLSFL
uniref:non-specific serine/threonine protein kinase n=1 Tax=Coptotermes formosanus TaxID=36987 RepID=L0AV63_COPFO|nr:serine/threonine protein kinase [Coptotermes formosanus]